VHQVGDKKSYSTGSAIQILVIFAYRCRWFTCYTRYLL